MTDLSDILARLERIEAAITPRVDQRGGAGKSRLPQMPTARTSVIAYLTRIELDHLDALAAEQGISRSRWIRDAILAAAEGRAR